MSVEAIVRVVEAEAAAEAARIVDSAHTRLSDLAAAAEAAAAERLRVASERAEPGYRAEGMRRVNAARVRLLERRAARAAELVDAVAQAAAERLETISGRPGDERWRAALERLVDETAAIIGRDGRIRVLPVDVEAVRLIVERGGCRLETGPLVAGDGATDDPLAAGVLGWSADGRMEVDATLRARLRRARTDLTEPVAQLLGVEA